MCGKNTVFNHKEISFHKNKQSNFYKNKKPFKIDDVDVNIKILVSKRESIW